MDALAAFGNDVSLAVLRIRLARHDAVSAGVSTGSESGSLEQVVVFELDVTGDPALRRLRPVDHAADTPNRGPETSASSFDIRSSGSPARAVARWVISPAEINLPLTYEEAQDFADGGGRVYDALTSSAKTIASALLKEFNADALNRYARSKSWVPRASPSLPPNMRRELQRILSLILVKEDDCLWVDIMPPVGYLPVISWEELLQPLTKAPVLRLSPHPIKALGSNNELNVVIACSFSSRQWLPRVEELHALVERTLAALPPRSRVRIFSDSLVRASFEEGINRLTDPGDEKRIELLPIPVLDSAAAASAGGSDSVSVLEHPWLAWMKSALNGAAVDIVHWISPGVLFADGARLLVARYPEEPEDAHPVDEAPTRPWSRKKKGKLVRYLTPQSLADASCDLGAWAMIFTATSRGKARTRSLTALRLLSDQLSRLRPGAVALQNLANDATSDALSETYRFLAGSLTPVAAGRRGLALYCHPDRVSPSDSTTVGDPEFLSAYLAATEAAREKLHSPGPSPQWVATTQRLVEEVASQYVSGAAGSVVEKSKADLAAERGAVAALKVIENLFRESTSSSSAGEDVK